ncbi:hypothetical protein evm_007683 [Chilo suppressalis]|nr:hypothetical protein evm_007683 [Chilo suppressalis]
MKLKELKRTVNPCWSPCEHYPVMLATGSAAQQVDSSFSSTSMLELYGLNLEDPGLDLELKSSIETQHKFQKLVWSGAGVIVGGCDGGLLEFYSAEKLLKNSNDALLGSSTKHSGHVSALDINPYQKNLLASGASESEIFIWDLNNSAQPMTPGQRSQPPDHVQGLAWNQQSVVVRLFRLAASPLATLEGHNKGVLSLSWSRHDAALLLSAGKDGRVLCWDPDHTNPGVPPLEVWSQPQWVFCASWSPRVAGLLASASFDQLLGVHSLLGYSTPQQSRQSSRSIVESFGGAAQFNQLPAVSAAPPAPRAPPAMPPRPPAWLRRPAAARLHVSTRPARPAGPPRAPRHAPPAPRLAAPPRRRQAAREYSPSAPRRPPARPPPCPPGPPPGCAAPPPPGCT